VKYSNGKTSGVLIGDEEVIKVFNLRNKSIKPTRGSYELCWLREKTCLERLEGKLHFPQLIDSDQTSLSLQMSACGESLFYTWQEHNLVLYLEQAHAIVDALTEANIQYFHIGMDPAQVQKNNKKIFPLSNFCIQDGELSLIDFEMANPVGSHLGERLHPRLKELYRNFSATEFRKFLIETLENPRKAWERGIWRKMLEEDRNTKYPKIIKENPRKVHESMKNFTTPSEKIVNEWKKYQKRYGMDAAIDRVARMNLSTVCTKDKNVVDIGCNDGYITMLVAPMVNSATGVEPHVELPTDKPDNVKWAKVDFNKFLARKTSANKFDVVLSLAVSIQLRDFGGLTEQEIVDGYASLLTPGGIVVHETQKLEDRPNNQEHTKWMLEAFATKFEIIDHGQARPGGRREYYHFQKV